jgi:excisionase family DNA binding protein
MAMLGNEMMSPLLTVREVAKLLNIHVNTVRRWGDQGILQPYRITNRGDRRFKREDIESFLTKLNSNGGDPNKAHVANIDISDKE